MILLLLLLLLLFPLLRLMFGLAGWLLGIVGTIIIGAIVFVAFAAFFRLFIVAALVIGGGFWASHALFS